MNDTEKFDEFGNKDFGKIGLYVAPYGSIMGTAILSFSSFTSMAIAFTDASNMNSNLNGAQIGMGMKKCICYFLYRAYVCAY